jgi:proline racemase
VKVKLSQMIPAYDVMAVGMVHRIAIGAAPQLKGASMSQKQLHLERDLDRLREAMVCGPADGSDIVGVLVTEATDPKADFGIIYFVRQGYWRMCGSGTFALGTLLVETGLVQARAPATEIALELVTGLMTLSVEVEDGRVGQVATRTAPVFHDRSVDIDLSGYGRVPVDISYCLNGFEPMLDARRLGIAVELGNRRELERVGLEIRDIVNASVELQHPLDPAANRVLQVQIYDPAPETPGVDCRCVAIYGADGFDLTPSGTSTCAHMAAKRAKGEMTSAIAS